MANAYSATTVLPAAGGGRFSREILWEGTIQQRSSKCILCHHCLAGCMKEKRRLKLSAFSSACNSKHACQKHAAAERCRRHKDAPGASGALHGVLSGAGGSRSAVVPMCRRHFRPQAAAIKAPSRYQPEVCAATSTECPASNALTAVCVRAKAEQRGHWTRTAAEAGFWQHAARPPQHAAVARASARPQQVMQSCRSRTCWKGSILKGYSRAGGPGRAGGGMGDPSSPAACSVAQNGGERIAAAVRSKRGSMDE